MSDTVREIHGLSTTCESGNPACRDGKSLAWPDQNYFIYFDYKSVKYNDYNQDENDDNLLHSTSKKIEDIGK